MLQLLEPPLPLQLILHLPPLVLLLCYLLHKLLRARLHFWHECAFIELLDVIDTVLQLQVVLGNDLDFIDQVLVLKI